MLQSCPQCQTWKGLAIDLAHDIRELFGRVEELAETAGQLEAQLERYAEDFHDIYEKEFAARQQIEGLLRQLPSASSEMAPSDLLGVAAHEIRNPLAVIHGFSELLLHRPLPAEQTKEFLSEVHRHAEHLNQLVNNLLSYTRAGNGRLDLQPRKVDLVPLLWEAVNTPYRVGGDHPIKLEVPDDLPPVWGDPTRLREILDNLLSNARKYSPAGGAIRVAAEVSGETVCIRVADEGFGIPPDQLEAVFEPFLRLPRDVATDLPGTGLGLSIVRQLVELHGGRIWAESAGEGHGTTFHFTLPTAESDRSAALRLQASTVAPNREPGDL